MLHSHGLAELIPICHPSATCESHQPSISNRITPVVMKHFLLHPFGLLHSSLLFLCSPRPESYMRNLARLVMPIQSHQKLRIQRQDSEGPLFTHQHQDAPFNCVLLFVHRRKILYGARSPLQILCSGCLRCRGS